MGLVDVRLGYGEVYFYSVEIRMAQGALEGVDIAPVAKVGDGKGVTKAVRVAVRNAGTFGQAREHAVEAGALHVGAGGCAGE